MNFYTTYLPSGEITGYGFCDPKLVKLAAGERLLEGENGIPETQWLDGSTNPPLIKDKERPPITQRGLEFSSIPHPAELTVTGAASFSGRVTEPEARLSFDAEGTYTITITSDDPRWLPYVAEVAV